MSINYEKLLLVLFLIGIFIFRTNILDATGYGADFDYIRNESIKLSRGEPIYLRILKGSLTHEEASGGKLPVLFPSVYYFMMVFTDFGKISVEQSYDNFQYLILVADIFSALIIYTYLKEKQGRLTGFFGLIFFLFNRWSTNAFFGGYFDPVALVFLIASIYYLGKKNILSAILLSCSILFKHFGLFVLPVFAIYWFKHYGIKNMLKYILFVVVPIIITIIPSIFVDFKGFFYSIMFNFTRKPDDNYFLPFMDNVSQITYQEGVLKNRFVILMINRLYFIFSYLPILYLTYKDKFSIKLLVFLVFFWFFLFNSKAFPQYYVWFIGTGLLALGDFNKSKSND
ncbi:MAG: hypothetical protein O2871_02395 [bacterium]|nr:hypothetical protein [bacterium]